MSRAEPSAWLDAVREAVGAILNAESPEEEEAREQEESSRLFRIAREALAREMEEEAERWLPKARWWAMWTSAARHIREGGE